jgi:manganese/zinc/iron transport system ATP- binding protein
VQVARGARDALVGANGSGKSTLLKAIVGLVPLQSGSISVHGERLNANRAGLAYLPQIGELDWRFPIEVRRLVLTGRYVHLGWLRRPGSQDRALVDAALERLGLQSVAGRQIGQISGGQRQRALLARALVQEADTLLLDEPFNAVDAESRDIVLDVLDDLRASGKTVVLATHDLERMNVDPDQVHALVDGRLAEVQQH